MMIVSERELGNGLRGSHRLRPGNLTRVMPPQGGTLVIVNGEQVTVPTPISVSALIRQQGLRSERVAVEVNGRIVTRGERDGTQLEDHDRIEIVSFVQGG